MSNLEQLSRNLASGMSRRKALWQFVMGLGVTTALTGRKANAATGINPECIAFCTEQAAIFESLCLQAAKSCAPGTCPEFSNSIAINSTVVINSGPFICVPVVRSAG